MLMISNYTSPSLAEGCFSADPVPRSCEGFDGEELDPVQHSKMGFCFGVLPPWFWWSVILTLDEGASPDRAGIQFGSPLHLQFLLEEQMTAMSKGCLGIDIPYVPIASIPEVLLSHTLIIFWLNSILFTCKEMLGIALQMHAEL